MTNNFEVDFETLTELDEHLKSGIGENLFFDTPILTDDLPTEVLEDLPF